MKFTLLFPTLMACLLFSCSGPNVVIEYQGSSPIPLVESKEDPEKAIQSSPEKEDPQVVVRSLPNLEGGNRVLKKKVTYPEAAIENEVEGTVSVQFMIDESGETSTFTVIEGIGHGCEEAVIEAIKSSKFEVGQNAGNFVWLVTVEFKL